jgi:hypothetical protein
MELGALRPDNEEAVTDPRLLEAEELDRRIRAGWEEWCDLLDGLLGSDGMLPSRKLAQRAAAFFEHVYWRAEEARVEALRRRLETESLRRRRGRDRTWGIT